MGSRRRCPAALTFTAEAAVPRVPFPVVLPVVPIISVVPIVPAVAVVPVVPIFASVPVVRRAWAPSVEVWKVEVQKQNEDALDTIRSTYIVLLASLRRDTDATTRRRRVAGTSLDDVSRLYVL